MIGKIKPKILKYYLHGSHAFNHTERVYNLAVRIAESEKDVDIKVVKLAALLHDVARFKETKESKICHAEEGSKMAKEILTEEGYDKEIINHVCDCISTHRYSKQLTPKSKEAAILQDADRLDVLGAITIGRIFGSGLMKGRPMYDPNIPPAKEYPSEEGGKTSMNHFKEKILKITLGSFNTTLAKEIAKERYQYVMDFVDRFEKEWRGEL
ncbi:MAG: HD domain-containing protein [Nanoarchaeota archaeon]|nr:HD domain-containing protein [Nanoarchaeota archaeon]